MLVTGESPGSAWQERSRDGSASLLGAQWE